MRVGLQHAVFGVILVVTLAANATTKDVLEDTGNFDPAILRVAESSGLIFLGRASEIDSGLQPLSFEAPSCSSPIRVTVMNITFEQDALTHETSGYVTRYVYIDQTWDKPDPTGILLKRTSQALYAMFGQTRYMPSWHLLRIDAPLDCTAAEGVAWSLVWDRAYLAAAQHDSTAGAN